MAKITIKGDTSGEVDIVAPAVAGTTTYNLSTAGGDILSSGDIGTTVQAHDANTAKYNDTTANFTGTLQHNGGVVATQSYVDSEVGAISVTPTQVSDQANTSTGYFDLPAGTTAQRPVSPASGMIRHNTTTGSPEWYDNGSGSWINFNASAPYNVDFLVVAGGGSGGAHAGSGAGAGGYRTSYGTGNISGGGGAVESALQFTPSTVYTITVGGGGAAVGNANGNNGANSSISGSGISTITSLGGAGGRGGASQGAGFSGGSGSGGSAGSGTLSPAGGAGTSGQGYAGGANNANWGTGGGGGAGAVGGNGVGSAAGNGGSGQASSISGSSVTRAGGGGGSGQTAGAGYGGAGGGGNGNGNNNLGSESGGANTGGGGGGRHSSAGAAGAGGSGVVILRIPTASYSGTQTGASVTTNGSDTILTFNSSGTYTG